MIAAKSTACSRFDSNFENVAASFSRFSRRGMLNKPVRPRFGPMAAVKRRASDASGGAMATPATLPVAVVACHPERHRGKVQRTLRRRGMVCERMHTQGNHTDMMLIYSTHCTNQIHLPKMPRRTGARQRDSSPMLHTGAAQSCAQYQHAPTSQSPDAPNKGVLLMRPTCPNSYALSCVVAKARQAWRTTVRSSRRS